MRSQPGKDAFGRPLPESGSGLNDRDREMLTRLEGIAQPSAYERGTLAALRLRTPGGTERARADALTQRWNKQAADAKAALDQSGGQQPNRPRLLDE